jgi:hypothetical protein
LLHRLSATLLCIGLIAGNAAICAGWALTPEERMACCAEGGTCPMHERGPHDSASHHEMTQGEADSCCASSRPEPSNRAASTVVGADSLAMLGPGVVLPASVPALVLSDDWRTTVPVPATPIPRYVLLSVFLV